VAPKPASYQFMLHAPRGCPVHRECARLRVDQPKAGVEVAYLSPEKLTFRQTDGFQPPPTREFPNLWHVETGTTVKRAEIGVVTVLVPHRAGQSVPWTARRIDAGGEVKVELELGGGATVVRFPAPGKETPVRVERK
jgi:hypothetical protein